MQTMMVETVHDEDVVDNYDYDNNDDEYDDDTGVNNDDNSDDNNDNGGNDDADNYTNEIDVDYDNGNSNYDDFRYVKSKYQLKHLYSSKYESKAVSM